MDTRELRDDLRPCDTSKPYAFMSYSSKDAETVWRDALFLQEQGCNIWIDEANVDKRKPSWKHDALSAISHYNCVLMLFYVSRSSLTSSPCLGEISNTVSKETASLHIADGKVPFVAVDAERIGHIGEFMNSVYDEIRNGGDPEAVKKTKLENMYSFRTSWFPPDNERVRIKNYSEYAVPIEYYNEIKKELDRQKVARIDCPSQNAAPSAAQEKAPSDEKDAPEPAEAPAAKAKKPEETPEELERKKKRRRRIIFHAVFWPCIIILGILIFVIFALGSCVKSCYDGWFSSPKNNTPEPTEASLGDGTFRFEWDDRMNGYSVRLAEGGAAPSELIIPSEINGKPVVRIEEGAFEDCTQITSAVIPDSVKEIGSGAFRGCNNIGELELPFIGRKESPSEEDPTENVLGYIFGCDGSVEIKHQIEVREEYRFGNNERILYAFPNRTIRENEVMQLVWGSPWENYTAACFIFFIPDSLEKVTVDRQREISPFAFGGCRHIREINLPEAADLLPPGAFRGCTGLEKLSLSGGSGFSDGILTIGAGFREIGAFAFEDCSQIVSASIGGDVRRIGIGAFKGLYALEDIEVPFIGNEENVTYDEPWRAVFGYIFGYEPTVREEDDLSGYWDERAPGDTVCLSLWTVHENEVNQLACIWQNWGQWKAEYYIYNVPDSLKRVTVTGTADIPYFAFANCAHLETVSISSVSKEQQYAFEGCNAEVERR